MCVCECVEGGEGVTICHLFHFSLSYLPLQTQTFDKGGHAAGGGYQRPPADRQVTRQSSHKYGGELAGEAALDVADGGWVRERYGNVCEPRFNQATDTLSD